VCPERRELCGRTCYGGNRGLERRSKPASASQKFARRQPCVEGGLPWRGGSFLLDRLREPRTLPGKP
jgi:hypothetical protein